MKKIVLAAVIALVGSFVTGSAMAQVTVYGAVNEYMVRSNTAGTVSPSVANDISNIGFKATEDLGSGLRANVQVETSVLANNPALSTNTTQLGDRRSTVGLSSNNASWDIGNNYHSLWLNQLSVDPFAHQSGTLSSNIHQWRSLRMSNSNFVSFSPVQGLTLKLDKAVNTTGVAGAPVGFGASYSFGAYSISASRYENSYAQTKSTLVGGSAQILPKTKLFLSVSRNNDADVEKNGYIVGVTQNLTSALLLRASYGKTSTVDDTKGYNVGASYSLSKRTSLEAYYKSLNLAGVSSDNRTIGVGVRASF